VNVDASALANLLCLLAQLVELHDLFCFQCLDLLHKQARLVHVSFLFRRFFDQVGNSINLHCQAKNIWIHIGMRRTFFDAFALTAYLLVNIRYFHKRRSLHYVIKHVCLVMPFTHKSFPQRLVVQHVANATVKFGVEKQLRRTNAQQVVLAHALVVKVRHCNLVVTILISIRTH